MDDRQIELCKYRIQEAEDSLTVAKNCLKDNFYKDTINRSYYAVFYAVKAILSLGTVDFKRHKDVGRRTSRNCVHSDKCSKGLFESV
ncbi:MAG: HEPN domain-containing protein [Muribaculaceae bacterium]|nr:HEPN domain-containing protein [Muribaculaceae bacterium]